MKSQLTISVLLMLALSTCLLLITSRAAEITNSLTIRSVEAEGKTLNWQPGGELNLGAFPRSVQFRFGFSADANEKHSRLSYKLDGFESAWQEGGGYMFLTVRFSDETGKMIDLKQFIVRGESAGWNCSLESSPLTHRRETFTVPPNATRLQVVISSGGPPSTMGIYVVDHLVLSKLSTASGKPKVLLRSPFDDEGPDLLTAQTTNLWQPDGTGPNMAQVVEIGSAPKTKALAIVDDDRFGHAEWHNAKDVAPSVAPNDNLVMEWNEMFSIGESRNQSSIYPSLPPGKYQFRVEEVTTLGKPTGVNTSLAVRVPRPYWETPWFWAMCAAAVIVAVALLVRYITSRRMRQAMIQLEQQRALEEERMRIARDIHDDLGARVTQISLMSGMAQKDPTLSEKARSEFDQIYLVSRDLVSALYETVWAVDPENDNLHAMGDYLRQTINELCTQAQLRCRLHVSPLPAHINVSSRIRHNFSMATREAVHNIIKHAQASLVTVHITFVDLTFSISIQDDGRGFKQNETPAGHGLVNIKRRLEGLGGSCTIESSPGNGTTIQLRLAITPASEHSVRNGSKNPASSTSYKG